MTAFQNTAGAARRMEPVGADIVCRKTLFADKPAFPRTVNGNDRFGLRAIGYRLPSRPSLAV